MGAVSQCGLCLVRQIIKKTFFLTEKAPEEMVIGLKRNKTLPPADENQILHFFEFDCFNKKIDTGKICLKS